MKAVNPTRNQYRGINAHLHSYWQAEGGWDSFHTLHIGSLTTELQKELLPRGYIADVEQSLQIRRLGEPIGKPESDVMVYDRDPVRAAQPAEMMPSAQAVAIPELMSIQHELAEYHAIAIYEHGTGKMLKGEPVVWIELLSPSNKPGGQDDYYYQEKRHKLLQSGLVFVELDYLHESPPTFDKMPRYFSRRNRSPEPGSHPYRIVVIDPRPVFHEGLAYPYYSDVDTALPVVNVPLSGKDVLRFDFGVPYRKTFEEALYGAIYVDYTQLPLNFDRYSTDDQARIVNRMIAVVKAAQAGVDLETHALLPVESLPLEEALAIFEDLKSIQVG